MSIISLKTLGTPHLDIPAGADQMTEVATLTLGILGIHHLTGRIILEPLDCFVRTERNALPAIETEPAAHAAFRLMNELLLGDPLVDLGLKPVLDPNLRSKMPSFASLGILVKIKKHILGLDNFFLFQRREFTGEFCVEFVSWWWIWYHYL